MEEEFKNAILEGDLNKVRECLKNGVDPNKEYLFESEIFFRGSSISKLLLYPIHVASFMGYLGIVEFLMSNNLNDPSIWSDTSLIFASQEGHRDVVKMLLTDSRVDPSRTNNRAIIDASIRGNFEVVQTLMQDSRVNPSSNNNMAIRYASKEGHKEVVKLLFKDKRVRNNLRKEDIKGLIEIEYKLYNLNKFNT